MKRCKLKSRPVLSHGTQVLLGADASSLGLSFIAMLSKEQDLFAKTVTSNLPILSVLWLVDYFLILESMILSSGSLRQSQIIEIKIVLSRIS